MRRAVFFDKDGTLVEDVPPNTDTSLVRFYPGVFTALRGLERAGFVLIIATNQGGIAEGRCSEADVRRMHAYVHCRLADEGITLGGFYYCPHRADGIVAPYAVTCLCRKPQPGLLLQAGRDLDLDMGESWMVGDILHDIEAGRRAGCRTVLVNNGHETEWRLTPTRQPDHLAPSVLAAAELIVLRREGITTEAAVERQQEKL
jgi:D-glycero-D-manno-heptose 1,7-bisphosphate phosphatase